MIQTRLSHSHDMVAICCATFCISSSLQSFYQELKGFPAMNSSAMKAPGAWEEKAYRFGIKVLGQCEDTIEMQLISFAREEYLPLAVAAQRIS